MPALVWQLALVLAAVAFVGAFVGGVHIWENRRFAAGRLRQQRKRLVRQPHVRVCVPCKGLDVGLDGNLRPLFAQDYDHYELAFVVESFDDPAAAVIGRLIEEHPHVPAELIAAGRAADSGQKVHNLRAATARLAPCVEILAFMDSDARPRADWIARLVERLANVDCGAATGYRWFVPQRASLANWLLYSINAQVAVMLGPGGHHVVWGGSWAIRRTTFTALSIRDAWQGAVSDDLVVSRRVRQSGLQVEYVPNCLVESPLDVTLPQLFEFVRRQYIMVRFHLPHLLVSGGAALTLAVAGFWGVLALAVAGAAWGAAGWPWLALACGAQYGLSVVRGVLRQWYLRTSLPETTAKVQGAWLFECLAGPLVTLVHGLGFASALVGREVTWRSIRYRLSSGGRVEVLTPRALHPVLAPARPHFRAAPPAREKVDSLAAGS